MYNPDTDYTTGVTRTKPSSPLRSVDPYIFSECLAWLRERVRHSLGRELNECTFDPEAGKWYLYEDGYLVLRIDHDTMERIWTILNRA